ncbi:MAG: cytoskeletal protein CcmA (bactofilin family), partial [Patiriisocius sp.]
GEVGSDLSILGGVAHLHASVTDDVRIVAGEVTLAEDIGGDVFVLAGSLTILSTANIAGEVFFFGGDLVIEGAVAGSLRGKAQKVQVDGSIGGDIDIAAPAGITLGDSANIEGSVYYTSFAALARGQGSVIAGEVVRGATALVSTKDQARDALIPIFITLFATLSLYLLFKKELQSLIESIENSFARSILIGSFTLILGPFVSLLLMFTVLGLFVGLLTFAWVLALYVAGIALSSVVLGAFVMRSMTKRLEVNLISILVGAFALQLFLLVPVVGPLTAAVVMCLTVGAIVERLYRMLA